MVRVTNKIIIIKPLSVSWLVYHGGLTFPKCEMFPIFAALVCFKSSIVWFIWLRRITVQNISPFDKGKILIDNI